MLNLAHGAIPERQKQSQSTQYLVADSGAPQVGARCKPNEYGGKLDIVLSLSSTNRRVQFTQCAATRMETRRRIEDETSVENDRQKKLPSRATCDHHQVEGSRQLPVLGSRSLPAA